MAEPEKKALPKVIKAEFTRKELLVRNGFIKSDSQEKYYFNDETNHFEPVEGGKLDAKDAEEENSEGFFGFEETGFPKPIKTYRLIWEAHSLGVEEPYYWIYKHIHQDFAFKDVYKTEDSFFSSESSAMFGVIQQRMSPIQERVSQYLIAIGRLVKELFQIVRELRILDEKLTHYRNAEEGKQSAEITLRGMFVDLVQGGSKNPASVFGMAHEVGFTALPDLFFDAPIVKADDVDRLVEDKYKDFNKSLRQVLKRQLQHFAVWKEKTHTELKARKIFLLNYLRQHYDTIQMYIEWIKPYLKYIERLSMKTKHAESPELIASFEGNMTDIEFLATKIGGAYQPVIVATFNFRTIPSMNIVKEGYQRGPTHTGRMEVTLRVYAWKKEQVDAYKKLKKDETFAFLSKISDSLNAALSTAGTDIEKYLAEAQRQLPGAEEKEEKEIPKKRKTFVRMVFGDFLPPEGAPKPPKKKKEEEEKAAADKEKAIGTAKTAAWNAYKNFKKAHGMIHW